MIKSTGGLLYTKDLSVEINRLRLNDYLRDTFGCKVYKITLNAGFTCPNRDETIGTGGCIFCSAGGSGEFAGSSELSITEQIELGKARLEKKIRDGKYIAYFQAYTNTYAPVERLRSVYMEAIRHKDIVAVSIATRPDCLPDEVLELLDELNHIKPIWVELGLQTIHEDTARYIRRGYELCVYDKAVIELRKRNIEVITHVILGLPQESVQDIIETVDYVCRNGATGIKLQLLHILKGTDLEREYLEGNVQVLSEDEYINILEKCIEVIPDDIVIHRLTGDGDKRILVAPLWSGDKKHVLNRINRIF